jgi:hypothetical protein
LTPAASAAFGQRLAVMGEHRLVGGDHVLAARDRGLGRGLGRAVLAAHELHEDVHIVAHGERDGVVLPRVGTDRDAPVLVAAARGDGGDLDRRPQRRASRLACRWTIFTTPVPTVPSPAMPRRTGRSWEASGGWSLASAPVSGSHGGCNAARRRLRAASRERGGAAAQAAVRASRLWPSVAAARSGHGVDTGQDRPERHEFGEIGGPRLGAEPRVERRDVRAAGRQQRGGEKADEERASHGPS